MATAVAAAAGTTAIAAAAADSACCGLQRMPPGDQKWITAVFGFNSYTLLFLYYGSWSYLAYTVFSIEACAHISLYFFMNMQIFNTRVPVCLSVCMCVVAAFYIHGDRYFNILLFNFWIFNTHSYTFVCMFSGSADEGGETTTEVTHSTDTAEPFHPQGHRNWWLPADLFDFHAGDDEWRQPRDDDWYVLLSMSVCLYSVGDESKNPPPEVFGRFFPNSWKFLVQILHAYSTFLSTLDYKISFSYLQLWWSYAILSATIWYAQNIHHRPKRTLGGRT